MGVINLLIIIIVIPISFWFCFLRFIYYTNFMESKYFKEIITYFVI